MRKRSWITLLIIIAVVILTTIILYQRSSQSVEESLAKCIGENSELYPQLGCSACKLQEEMFGENYKFLTVTDCFYEREICAEKEIRYTPTWIINGKKYVGVQNIEKLKELTGC